MTGEGYTLTQKRDSNYDESEKGPNGTGLTNLRRRAVVNMTLAGYTPDEIADQLGYAGPGSVYQTLKHKDAIAHMQEVMDYYDIKFSTLYPEVISAVADGLRSVDEKVSLEASKIWLKSHGRMDKREISGPAKVAVSVENLVANILVQAKEHKRVESRSNSDREPIQDTEQRKINRRFYSEPEPS